MPPRNLAPRAFFEALGQRPGSLVAGFGVLGLGFEVRVQGLRVQSLEVWVTGFGVLRLGL